MYKIDDHNGTKRYTLHGVFHRLDGPAIEWSFGGWEWYFHGQLHRIGGPAVFLNETYIWFFLGKRHREDGPAIEVLNKPSLNRWYYNGDEIKCSSQKEFERLLKLKAFW